MSGAQTAMSAIEAPVEEHRALREGCGLIDRSERGKLALTGSGSLEFLDGQLTNELAGLRAGEGRYAAFLTPKGKMLGDVAGPARRSRRSCGSTPSASPCRRSST